MAPEEQQEAWQIRMREIQGALVVASLFQIVIGFTGIFFKELILLSTVQTISLRRYNNIIMKYYYYYNTNFSIILVMKLLGLLTMDFFKFTCFRLSEVEQFARYLILLTFVYKFTLI